MTKKEIINKLESSFLFYYLEMKKNIGANEEESTRLAYVLWFICDILSQINSSDSDKEFDRLYDLFHLDKVD